MKRLILSAAIMLLVAGGVQAQTTEKKEVKTAKAKKATGKKSAKTTKVKGVKATSEKLNDRKMYKANNGQSATPTGHEATGTGGGFTSLKKDTAVIQPKDTTNVKQKERK